MYTEYVAAMHRLASKHAIHFIDSGSLAMRYLAALEGGLGGNYTRFDSLLFKDDWHLCTPFVPQLWTDLLVYMEN